MTTYSTAYSNQVKAQKAPRTGAGANTQSVFQQYAQAEPADDLAIMNAVFEAAGANAVGQAQGGTERNNEDTHIPSYIEIPVSQGAPRRVGRQANDRYIKRGLIKTHQGNNATAMDDFWRVILNHGQFPFQMVDNSTGKFVKARFRSFKVRHTSGEHGVLQSRMRTYSVVIEVERKAK